MQNISSSTKTSIDLTRSIGINYLITLQSEQILVDFLGVFDEKVATKF